MNKRTLTTPEFQDVLIAFERRKYDEGKSDSHIKSVIGVVREFLSFLESIEIMETIAINQKGIDQYFTYLKNRKNLRRPGGLSNAYLLKHREGVLRFMEFLHQVDIGGTAFYIPIFKEPLKEKDILSVAEIQLLFKNTDHTMNGARQRAILSALYGCGLRKGELFRLNIDDLDMSRQVLRVRKSKTAQQRDVPMTMQVMKHFEEYLYGVRELLLPEGSYENAFLLNNNGKRMSLFGIQHKVNTLSSHTGITKPLTAHRLRHAIATHLLDSFSIEEIALFLGHKNIDSSQIYTHYKYTKRPSDLNGTNNTFAKAD